MSKKEAITGWLFIAPALIGLIIFIYGAMIYSLGISFTSWDLLTPAKWVGIENYRTVFDDKMFFQCLNNTLFFVVTMVPFVIIFSMAIA